MSHRLLHLALLLSQFPSTFGAIVTLSSFIEVTETVAPGGVPPTAAKTQPEAPATAKVQHTTTTRDNPEPQKTDTVPPPVAPPSTTADASTQGGSISSITDSGVSALVSATTTSGQFSTLSLSATESPTSGLSSPSAAASPNANITANKGAIIGGVSAAGAVVIALLIAAFFWWQRRKRRQDGPNNRGIASETTKNYRHSILKAKSKLNMFNKAKDSDEASVTSFKSRGMGSLFRSYSRSRQSTRINTMSISAPMPHPGHDTLADISKGPYEATFSSEQPSSPAPPVPPHPAYINPTASNRVSTMSVIQEYSPVDAAFRHSTEYNDDDKSQYNQGYPMTTLPSSPRSFSRGRPPHKSPRSPRRTRSRSGHRSHMTAFPDGSDPYTSMHGALGTASYVPPARPAVNTERNNDNYGYRESIYSEYTDIRLDPDHRATRYPY